MNKLTFSILLVGLFAAAALARSSPQTRRPFQFTPGQTYIYEYRGRQWNGVAKLADQYSGLNLEYDVILQALPAGGEVVMKLDDIKVEQIHTQSLDQNDILKLNKGREQNEHQIAMYKEELAKPIRFSYLDGKVVRFEAESSDPEWSINIKKSVLSLFQLDLAPTKTIKDSQMTGFNKQRQFNGYPSEQQIFQSTGAEQQAMPLVYPIYEEAFGGICETLYQIDSVENVDEQRLKSIQQTNEIQYSDVLNVTKTVNYKNCLTDPSVSYDRHAFDLNTQTFKGQLFSKQPYVESLGLNANKQQQQFAHSTFDFKDSVASEPVDRYSFTKYNISTVSQRQPLINGRYIAGPFQQQDVSVIEGVYSEGKIKYQADGDLLVSDTQQTLKLVSCAPTSELARLLPEISGQLVDVQPKQPTVQYETIQCELSQQKLKFYQAVSKFAQMQQSLQANDKPQTTFYNHKLVLPYALSASWYPLVASGKQTAEEPAELLLNPDELAKSYEQLLFSLADDIITEDVAQSKRAGEKIVRIVNAVSFMPKYKLAEVYEKIIEEIKQAKQQQLIAQKKQTGRIVSQTIDNELVSKWKVVRKLYLDSLPLAGSKQAIEMIEQLIESQLVKDWEAKEICEAVPANLRYPDTEIIDAFIRISQLPHVRKNRQLFASTSIAVGKMIGSAYIKSKDATHVPTVASQWQQDQIYRQVVDEANTRRQLPTEWMKSREQQDVYERLVVDQQDLIRYVKLFKQLLTQATTHHEKIVYIETLAHMRVAEVLPILEPYVSGRLSLGQCLGQQSLEYGRPIERSQLYNNKLYNRQYLANKPEGQDFDWTQEEAKTAEECNYMRALTIYAMAHVVRSAPGQVQAMLLPVFDNTYEPYQIRIAAFTTLTLAPVEDHILQRIASQMWREPNKEVASFVVGTIDTMSKFTAPMMAPWKEAAIKAAESMPRQYLDTWKFSWFAGGDHFNHQKSTGRTWVAEIIKSNVSSVPRAGYVHYGRYHGNRGHKFDNIVELGFTSKGIETLIKDYVTYCQERDLKTGSWSLVASIMENLYEAKDDLANYYRESRDNLKKSILMPEEMQTEQKSQLYSKNYHFKREQPIQDVNSKLGKLERKTESLFDVNGSRSKRSVTIKARNSRLNEQQTDAQEEPKLTIFSKLFDSTSYHSMDRKAIVEMLEKSDDYIKMIVDELVLGGKLHYVKMIVPSNMWHMVPSQIGLPVIATHRTPMVFSLKLDGSKNGQLTSTLMSQYFRQQQQQQQPQTASLGQNYYTNTLDKLNITALVHPKIIHSNFRFLFAVEQANCEAYGVQVEKSHQVSLPMELSVAYSQPKQLVSFTVEPKTQVRALWVKEAAKTFIGPVSLSSSQQQNWLGQEQLIRTSDKSAEMLEELTGKRYESIVPASIISGVQGLIGQPKESQWEKVNNIQGALKFDHRFVQQLLGLELQLEGLTDDHQVVAAIHRPETITMTQEQIEELDQHSKSGPIAELLHVVDSHMNRPSKYLEFYSTIKPSQSNKSPVYRFNFVVDGTTGMNQDQTVQQQRNLRFYNKNIQSVSNTIGRRQKAIDTKILDSVNDQYQQPLVDVY